MRNITIRALSNLFFLFSVSANQGEVSSFLLNASAALQDDSAKGLPPSGVVNQCAKSHGNEVCSWSREQYWYTVMSARETRALHCLSICSGLCVFSNLAASVSRSALPPATTYSSLSISTRVHRRDSSGTLACTRRGPWLWATLLCAVHFRPRSSAATTAAIAPESKLWRGAKTSAHEASCGDSV